MTIDSCPKEEYLEIQEEIYNLAIKVFSEEYSEMAEKISLDLISSKKKKEMAKIKLKRIVGSRPSRPLFYANSHVSDLPRYTRNLIRYLGDYIDHLIKFWSSELNGKKFLTKSLGVSLKFLKGKIDEDLRQSLIVYNDYCYVPAKHDFNVKKRKHRFTCKEAVYIALMTMELGEIIKKNSEIAKKYALGEIDDNWAPMKYSLENKDSFYEE